MKKPILAIFVILIILGAFLPIGFDFMSGARVGTTNTILLDLAKSSLFSQDCKKANQALLPSLTEEEIAQYTVSYPSGIGSSDEVVLRQMIKKSECQRYTPVLVNLGNLSFNIPMNYMTPWGDYENQFSTDRLGFSAFMPGFTGFDRRNFIDNFDRSKVEVFLYPESNLPGPDTDLGINRLK